MSAVLPLAIDPRTLAQSGLAQSGEAPLSDFERLADGLPVIDVPLAAVRWTATAEWRQPLAGLASTTGLRDGTAPQLWLHLQADAEVPQTCQRCLGAFGQPVAVDRWFRFVADEATALAEDDDSEEDLLVLEPRLDLATLIEDELLLALPLVPMHEACPQPVRMSAGEPGDEASDERPHPFAALAALKGRNSST